MWEDGLRLSLAMVDRRVRCWRTLDTRHQEAHHLREAKYSGSIPECKSRAFWEME